METSRFQGGQVRTAGSLETSNRKYVRNNRIEIERETSSFYDELFAPSRSSAMSQQKQTISPSNNRLYKSTNDFNAADNSDSPNQRRRNGSPQRNLRRDLSQDSDLESASFTSRSPKGKRREMFQLKNVTNTGVKSGSSTKSNLERAKSTDTITSLPVSAMNNKNTNINNNNNRIDAPLSDEEESPPPMAKPISRKVSFI